MFVNLVLIRVPISPDEFSDTYDNIAVLIGSNVVNVYSRKVLINSACLCFQEIFLFSNPHLVIG